VDDFKLDPEDILVAIGHPAGTAEMPLSEWMRTGPGSRPFVRPVRARSRRRGEELPLAVIPIAFRNTHTSRALIAAGQMDAPWPAAVVAPAGERESDPELLDRVLLAELFDQMPYERSQVNVNDQAIGGTRTNRQVLETEAPAALRDLASAKLWDDFDAVVAVAADLGLCSIVPMLGEVLESEEYPRDPTFLIDTLAMLGTPEAVHTLVDQLARSVTSGASDVASRRCLYALYGVGAPEARRALLDIAEGAWPMDIRRGAQYLSTLIR
jgi:hypothetical protein